MRNVATCLTLALVAMILLPRAGVGDERESQLEGDFAVTIAAEDVPPELIGGAAMIGRWQISFEGSGAYVIGRQDVGQLVRGQFETDGPQLTLREETGVVACETNPDNGVSAVYEWNLQAGRLLLTAVEEPCDTRRLLLTSRAFSSYAACPALAADRGGAAVEASPERPGRPPAATPGQATPWPVAWPTEKIDTLLKQMSDCWATRNPDRFLRLLSQEHRADQAPVGDAARRRYELNMAAPIVWDLAGDVELVNAARATAQVRQTLGDNIDIVDYAFVLEEGSWRWDGIAGSP